MHKRILVTGGAGFLGSNLCARLLAAGHDVICLDNFQTGQMANIQPFLNHANFCLLQQDVCLPLDLDVDEIYNLACPASPPQYQKNPIDTLKTNVLGALSVLDLAHRQNATVLQASTSEVYGDPLEHPQQETYWGNVNPIGPRSCYDEGKRAAETLFFDYHRQHHVAIKIARIFNTYGPNMHPEDGRVVSNFITQALRHQPLTIYGKGDQTRSFCFVDDTVDGLMRLMASTQDITGPINLGNPQEFTMLELAQEILKLCPQSQSQIVYHPLPKDDPTRRRPDITRAKTLLGWEPTIDLSVGLKHTIDYFQSLSQIAA
jgi:UDP-glucuronate decarboxylase